VLGYIVNWEDVTSWHTEKIRQSSMLTAIDKTQAIIEFQTDGTILTANENFRWMSLLRNGSPYYASRPSTGRRHVP